MLEIAVGGPVLVELLHCEAGSTATVVLSRQVIGVVFDGRRLVICARGLGAGQPAVSCVDRHSSPSASVRGGSDDMGHICGVWQRLRTSHRSLPQTMIPGCTLTAPRGVSLPVPASSGLMGDEKVNDGARIGVFSFARMWSGLVSELCALPRSVGTDLALETAQRYRNLRTETQSGHGRRSALASRCSQATQCSEASRQSTMDPRRMGSNQHTAWHPDTLGGFPQGHCREKCS